MQIFSTILSSPPNQTKETSKFFPKATNLADEEEGDQEE